MRRRWPFHSIVCRKMQSGASFPRPTRIWFAMELRGAFQRKARVITPRSGTPNRAGSDASYRGFETGSKRCVVNQDIVAVSLRDKTVSTTTGECYRWNAILSSLPLDVVCRMTDDDELVAASAKLSHSSTISFNIGIRGPLRPEFADIHWLYVPDRTIPFYRVGFYSNIGKGACSPGFNAIYVEVGMPSDEVDRTNLVHDLQPKVIESLEYARLVGYSGRHLCRHSCHAPCLRAPHP